MFKLDLRTATTFYEIGFKHGRAVAEAIKDCIQKLKTKFGPESAYAEQLFMKGTDYLKDIQTYLPNIYEEFCGLCDGSEVEQGDLLLLNCLDESYLLLKESKRIGRCTSFGISSGNGTYLIGQNLDFIDIFDGYQMCAIIKSPIDGQEIFQMGYVGQIFGVGANEKGLSIVSTSLLNGAVNFKRGVPNTFVQKAILYTKNVEEAIGILKGCPVSTATGWTLADSEQMICAETTAKGIVLFPKADYYVHTNHCLVSKDVSYDEDIFGDNGLILHDGYSWEMTHERLVAISNYVKNDNLKTIEGMSECLSKPPIHRIDTSLTLWSVIMESGKENNRVFYRGSNRVKEFEIFQFG